MDAPETKAPTFIGALTFLDVREYSNTVQDAAFGEAERTRKIKLIAEVFSRDSDGRAGTSGGAGRTPPLSLMLKRSFVLTSGSSSGFVLEMCGTSEVPRALIRNALFSFACATEFKRPVSMPGSDAVTAFLSKLCDGAVQRKLRLSLSTIGLRLDAAEAAEGDTALPETDAMPWIETVGKNGFAGYYARDGDAGTMLAFALVSSVDLESEFADGLRNSSSKAAESARSMIEGSASLRVERAVKRCARRILARMLGFMGVPDGVAKYEPDRESAPSAACAASTRGLGDAGADGAYERQMICARPSPHLSVPQYEQEFDTFVPGSAQGNIAYCCGIVPYQKITGGLIVSIGGFQASSQHRRSADASSAPTGVQGSRGRFEALMVRRFADIEAAEHNRSALYNQQARQLQQQLPSTPAADATRSRSDGVFRARRIYLPGFFNCWMHCDPTDFARCAFSNDGTGEYRSVVDSAAQRGGVERPATYKLVAGISGK